MSHHYMEGTEEHYFLVAWLDGGLKTYGFSKSLLKVQRELDAREQRTPKHVCPQFQIMNRAQYQRALKKDTEDKAKLRAERKARGQERAARTREKNKERGVKPHFILCPTCSAKSKKLRSEMGGLETRKCQNGHFFEVDTYFGWEANKRRVENIDRPIYTGPVSYTDYVYGKYKDDPDGEQDR